MQLFISTGDMALGWQQLISWGLAALIIYCIIDIIRSSFKEPLNKFIWLLVVVFIPVIGAIIYLARGKATKLIKEDKTVY